MSKSIEIYEKVIAAIPEIELAVGKLGRAETSLDPAPISMIETIINYKPEFLTDKNGHPLRFRFDPDEDDFFAVCFAAFRRSTAE